MASFAWLIPGPGPDERLGSVVERAANQYGVTAADLLRELDSSEWGKKQLDIDSAGVNQILGIARAIGTSPMTLWPHRLPNHPSLLIPRARMAVCRQCWNEDLEAGRPTGYRRDWASVLRTCCTRHGVALELMGPIARGAGLRVARKNSAFEKESRMMTAAIEQFGRTLEDALFFAGAWPSDWMLSARRARAVLLALSLNLSDTDAFPPLSRMACEAEMFGVIHTPRHATSPLRCAPWDAFRAISDPALRRAAIWVVAWWTCPNWPEEWRPGWFRRDLTEEFSEAAISSDRLCSRLVSEAMKI